MKTIDFKKISLRKMTEDDHPLSFEIYASTRREEMKASGWPQQQVEEFLQQQALLQHQHYMKHYKDASFEIISYKGEDVGRLYHEMITPKELRIVDIALLPSYRNRGVGGKLLNDLLMQAESNMHSISIHVEISNPAMDYFYKKLGFQFVREAGGVYHLMQWDPSGQRHTSPVVSEFSADLS